MLIKNGNDFSCVTMDNADRSIAVRRYLSSLIFSYMDTDSNFQLSYKELNSEQLSLRLPMFSHTACQLLDLLWYEDVLYPDGLLSFDEFHTAFSEFCCLCLATFCFWNVHVCEYVAI